jgi:hypothetical protein
MRGEPERQMAMLTTLATENLIPADHPIRRIRKVVDEVMTSLDASERTSSRMSPRGRPRFLDQLHGRVQRGEPVPHADERYPRRAACSASSISPRPAARVRSTTR